jgi:hypothetical protein
VTRTSDSSYGSPHRPRASSKRLLDQARDLAEVIPGIADRREHDSVDVLVDQGVQGLDLYLMVVRRKANERTVVVHAKEHVDRHADLAEETIRDVRDDATDRVDFLAPEGGFARPSSVSSGARPLSS